MSLSARALALQGIGFAAALVAVQGFMAAPAVVPEVASGAAHGSTPASMVRNMARLQREDQLAVELITALFQMEFFDGTL